MPTITTGSKLSAALGGSTARKLEEAFGFVTVGDLLAHYPRTHVERGETSDPSGFEADEHATVVGRVVSADQHPYRDRRSGRMAFRLEVEVAVGERSRLSLTFFDKRKHTADWRLKRLRPGQVGMFAGRVAWDKFKKRWQLVHPQTDVFDRDTSLTAEARVEEERAGLSGLRPIYPATRQLSSWVIEDSVKLVLELVEPVPDPLPAAVRLQHGLLSAGQALAWIHRPDSWPDLRAAEKRLRFEEAFVTQTVLAQRRAELARLPATPRLGRSGGLLERFDEQLPFDLTNGQRVVGQEILDDLAAGHPMHRLLQGEVGSGKTVVALRAMLRVVDSGGQAAMLAPTEVLAQQHHRSILALLGELAAGGMLGGAEDGTRVALLTGSQGAAARRNALAEAASGGAGIIVGTHALLEEQVEFADLGLVVVDEQHRFGVEQRAALAAKSEQGPPHVLVMTATPIPRTVAMTVFGDLETSTLRELPAGRAEIHSAVVPMLDRPEWLERSWLRLREEAKSGGRSYVVCPRIGGDREPKDEDDSELASVEEIATALREGVLRGRRVEILHGRLPTDRKEEAMRAFTAGEVDVLVSTTVIEVGVDVPQATVMVVLDADRFGVSQLHQLRGRVGRGGLPGLCLLVTRAEAGSIARARLEAVAGTLDGFELSRIDLEQRREGDVLGAAQSGRRSGLRLLSVLRHEEVILAARESAAELVARDPGLASEPALADAVRLLAETGQGDYIEKT